MFFKDCDLYEEQNGNNEEEEKPTFNFLLAYALFSAMHR